MRRLFLGTLFCILFLAAHAVPRLPGSLGIVGSVPTAQLERNEQSYLGESWAKAKISAKKVKGKGAKGKIARPYSAPLRKALKTTVSDPIKELGKLVKFADRLNKIKPRDGKSEPRNPRKEPGKVTASNKLLNTPTRQKQFWSEGSPKSEAKIPPEIAKKLNGKEFKNFDQFRKKFWKDVGDNTSLAKEFGAQRNRTRMQEGKAPQAPISEQVGKRTSYELHHVKPIKDGGKVYDLDNIVIVSPKKHIEIHKDFKE